MTSFRVAFHSKGAFFLMDGERKYRQHGYQDTNQSGQERQAPPRQGPRPPLDITGPRLPRLVQSVTASRCYNCAVALPTSTDWLGVCPKCNASLHCCKQCAHFEPATRFQCRKPVPVRIVTKDAVNECGLFSPRVTVARDVVGPFAPQPVASATAATTQTPRNAADARAMFDSLFKK